MGQVHPGRADVGAGAALHAVHDVGLVQLIHHALGEEAYEELNSNLPDIGEKVKTFDGFKGEVVSVNVLRQKVKIVVEVDDEREIKEYAIDELKFKPKKKKFNLASEELKALKGLEDKEESKLD